MDNEEIRKQAQWWINKYQTLMADSTTNEDFLKAKNNFIGVIQLSMSINAITFEEYSDFLDSMYPTK